MKSLFRVSLLVLLGVSGSCISPEGGRVENRSGGEGSAFEISVDNAEKVDWDRQLTWKVNHTRQMNEYIFSLEKFRQGEILEVSLDRVGDNDLFVFGWQVDHNSSLQDDGHDTVRFSTYIWDFPRDGLYIVKFEGEDGVVEGSFVQMVWPKRE